MTVPALLFAVALLLPQVAVAAPETVEPKGAASSGPVVVRSRAVVQDRLIRLGDLFENVGEKADVVVGYAPEAGRRAVFDVRWLQRLARAHGLDWRPLSANDTASVERESLVIGAEDIERFVIQALDDRGVDTEGLEIALATPMLRLHVPIGGAAEMHVSDLALDERSGRFVALLAAPADDGSTRPFRIAGTIQRLADVPVPARRIASGEVIGASDLTWVRQKSQTLRGDVVLDADRVIGLTPKHGLKAGAPIRTADVSRPLLVAKGDLVTVTLATPHMTLTARARALEDGGEGDVVRVTNLESRKIIDAVVTGSGEVRVDAPVAAVIR